MTHVILCLKCGRKDEAYYPSFAAAEVGLKNWRCPECGCDKHEKRPQDNPGYWHFAGDLKGK